MSTLRMSGGDGRGKEMEGGEGRERGEPGMATLSNPHYDMLFRCEFI